MGGKGSGNWYRCSTSLKVDNVRCIDINRMLQEGAIKTNAITSGTWVWKDAETGEQTSSIGYAANTDTPSPYVRLNYTIIDTDESCDYMIKLSATTPHYGGKRYWFICPYTGKRTTKLYRPYGAHKYGSRQAFNLKYKSQSECRISRMINKKWKLQKRLDGAYGHIRPKGMHRKTFESLLDDIFQLEDMIDYEISARYGYIV